MRTWRDYLENILIAVFLALLVRTFVVTGYKVPTSSMAPTLFPGDFIFSYRLPYGVKVPLTDTKWFAKSPERGQVVVFTYSEQPKTSYVKRVVGTEGDRIQLSEGSLIVNDEKLKVSVAIPESELEQEWVSQDLFKLVNEDATEGPRKILVQKNPKLGKFGPIVVPPGHVFLLGDNRDSSDDSRYWGTVPIERIEGRVFWIWLSVNWQKKIWDNRVPTVRWDRTWSGLTP
jgi:signal peptidase I